MVGSDGPSDLQHVMGSIDQCPFAADLVMVPLQELPEATSLLDLDSRVNRTASDLNASVNRRRVVFGMQTANFIIPPPLWMCL